MKHVVENGDPNFRAGLRTMSKCIQEATSENIYWRVTSLLVVGRAWGDGSVCFACMGDVCVCVRERERESD